MNKIAYLTWLYPKAKKYFKDYAISINNQTFTKVDLFYINNGLDSLEIQSFFSNLLYDGSITLLKTNYNSSLYIKIIFALKSIQKNGYDFCIFGDVDDTFSMYRFENYSKVLSDNYIVFYNDLLHQMTMNNVFCAELPSTISFNDIETKNFLGMSNTAINLSMINFSELDFDWKEVLVFDWVFFSMILGDNKYGMKVNNAETYYRIHSNNQVGMPCNRSLDNLIFSLKVKLNHDRILSNIKENYSSKANQLIYAMTLLSEVTESNKIIQLITMHCKYWWDLDYLYLINYMEKNDGNYYI